MILLPAAKYVEGDLRAELGNVPPVGLPVGNRVLLSYQVELISAIRRPGELAVLSLPEDYKPSLFLSRIIDNSDLTVVNIPNGLSLADSLLYAVNMLAQHHDDLRILHGDTLLASIPSEPDCLGLVKTPTDYHWEAEPNSDGMIWGGYFSFSDIPLIVRCLTMARADFAGAVRLYAEQQDIARVELDGWRDFGHANTYFGSRSMVTSERAFNSLQIKQGIVHKRSQLEGKVDAEATWFERLPLRLKPFVPAYYGRSPDQGYYLEYLVLCPLNEIFVHGRRSSRAWAGIFHSVATWFASAAADPADDGLVERIRDELIVTKTQTRFADYCDSSGHLTEQDFVLNGVTLPPSKVVIHDCIEKALSCPVFPGIVHGDLCFSNAFYDSRASRLRVLDPRGARMAGGGDEVGDMVYDLAKLAHSVLGLYDFIIAEGYDITVHTENEMHFAISAPDNITELQNAFLKTDFLPGLNVSECLATMVLLFFSMLPLHADKPHRQRALLANAYRCYQAYLLQGNP